MMQFIRNPVKHYSRFSRNKHGAFAFGSDQTRPFSLDFCGITPTIHNPVLKKGVRTENTALLIIPDGFAKRLHETYSHYPEDACCANATIFPNRIAAFWFNRIK